MVVSARALRLWEKERVRVSEWVRVSTREGDENATTTRRRRGRRRKEGREWEDGSGAAAWHGGAERDRERTERLVTGKGRRSWERRERGKTQKNHYNIIKILTYNTQKQILNHNQNQKPVRRTPSHTLSLSLSQTTTDGFQPKLRFPTHH